MFRLLAATLLLTSGLSLCRSDEVHWRQQNLTTDFVSEGATVADLDGDGNVDVVSGPWWWRGPGFSERFEYREGKPFDPKGYSDHFFSFTADIDQDGRPDIISVGFPGQQATAYINPGEPAANQRWKSTVIADQVANESPALVDLVRGGLPELVCSRGGQFGYYEAGDDGTSAWQWRGVSTENVTHNPFGHGLGIGDVDGDGKLDLLDPTRWWKQPDDSPGSQPWKVETWAIEPYGSGGAQILVHDVDGDDQNDIITSHHAHGYGLSWFSQKQGEEGRSRFIRHGILGESSIDNPFGTVFSQLHALSLADVDGDGNLDIVTGKRWWAHGGNDPGGNDAPVLYWFSGAADEGGEHLFQPHLIDESTGVGTEVDIADLNNDGLVDIISSNKKGVTLHFQTRHDDADQAGMLRWDVGAESDAGFAQSRPANEAASAMRAPKGFDVDLIASEPQLAQPIAMCFDARGRIWIAEGHTYPVRAPEGEGRDRIVILEDADADGSFETQKVFAENLNLVSGIEVGFGGVWIGAAPNLLFIPDANADDVPDSEARVLLDGWGFQDTHETLNSFTWGPDGWLYGCHGVFTHSKVGKPGTPDAARTPLNAAIWRYHPTRHHFEVFAWGGSNQWGIDFNDQGDWFMECCVIPHLFHVIQGARYHRQAGQHFNPHIYQDLTTIADHLHYGDGSFGSMRDGGRVDRDLVRRTEASTSMVGGGHAHCGMAVYLGDSFPESYYGDLFFHNLHGHRMVRESVSPSGSGYVGHHRPDLVRSEDHAFVGVTVILGPDGSLFYSDWHDPQTCHHRDPEIWDRSNGRVFRLRHGDLKSTSIDLPDRDDAALIELLSHRNAFIARQSALLLQQRSASGQLDRKLATKLLTDLDASHAESRLRLRFLWTRHCCELISDSELLGYVNDPDPVVRGWAIQLYCEQNIARTESDWEQLANLTQNEPSLLTLRYLASALQRLPHGARLDCAANITSHRLFSKDKNLPLLVWYGIEPLAEDLPQQLLERMTDVDELRSKVVRRISASDAGREAIAESLSKEASYDRLVAGLEQWKRWLPESSSLAKPPAWDSLRARGEELIAKRGQDDRQLEEQLRQLGVRFGDANAYPYYRDRVLDEDLNSQQRSAALDLLRSAGDKEAAKLAVGLIVNPDLRDSAVKAIVSIADPSVAEDLVPQLSQLPAQLRGDLINFLASRPDTARMLVSAIKTKTVNATVVPGVLLRQMQSHDDPELKALIESIWGRIQAEPADFAKRKSYWLDILSDRRLSAADVGHGRHLYDQICGNCHKLHGAGKEIGPDLTGSNRRDLGYVLENVLAPNAIIGNAYQMHAFLLDDGRLINGLIQAENDEQIRIVMAAGTELTIDHDAIESRKRSGLSMMPTELFEKMNHADVVDLVAYLATDRQVKANLHRQIPDGQIDPGDVFEAEWLAGNAKASAGRVRKQGMGGFRDQWSGDAQLWWTGARRGAKLELPVPSARNGDCDITLYMTTASDYATIRAKVNDQQWKSADLFTKDVRQLDEPLKWKSVPLKEHEPVTLTIEMTGANEKAVKSWMLGIDRVEIVPTVK